MSSWEDDLNARFNERLYDNDVPVDKDALRRLCLVAESDLAALGWDQPPKIYAIRGTVDDPRMDLIATMTTEGHPIDVMQKMWDDGVRMPADALGIILTHEGWAHYSYDDLAEHTPEIWAGLVAIGRKVQESAGLAGVPMTDEEVEEIKAEAYTQFQVSTRPSTLPPDRRAETRMVSVMFRGDKHVMLVRYRHRDEPTLLGLDGGEEDRGGGDVADALKAFLAGERPSH